MMWERRRLGDVVSVVRRINSEKAMPYVGMEHISSGTGEFLGELTPTMVKSNTFIFEPGHLLYGRLRPYLNKVLLPDFSGHCSTEVFPMKPSSEVDSRFLFYWITSEPIVDRINATCTGARMPRANVDEVLDFEIPLPPLPEQQRIVTKLDAAFAALSEAQGHVERNRANARELFESYLNGVFEGRDGQKKRKVKDLCHEVTVGHVGPMVQHYKQSGIPFLRSQNIRPFRVTTDNPVFIDEKFNATLKKSELHPGDLIIVRTGYPGTAAVLPDSMPRANCSDMVIMRTGPDLDPNFLAAFFNSRIGKQLVLGRLVGAAQKHFNITVAREVELSVPPVGEQRKLVEAINEVRIETEKLETTYAQKLTELEGLKKAVLGAAFRGEL
ncbi:MAG: restriction endonuclease subunit S [Flavobacteriales bacterium]|jgi:type I restriction enzyme S subunit|nr:restriction endonuclease subunit S [Flavobacteriales bacterium]